MSNLILFFEIFNEHFYINCEPPYAIPKKNKKYVVLFICFFIIPLLFAAKTLSVICSVEKQI